jgi:hypothetical protein
LKSIISPGTRINSSQAAFGEFACQQNDPGYRGEHRAESVEQDVAHPSGATFAAPVHHQTGLADREPDENPDREYRQ